MIFGVTYRQRFVPPGTGAVCEVIQKVIIDPKLRFEAGGKGSRGPRSNISDTMLNTDERTEMDRKPAQHKETYLMSRIAAKRAVSKLCNVPMMEVSIPVYSRVLIKGVETQDVRVAISHEDLESVVVAWRTNSQRMMFGVDVINIARVAKVLESHRVQFCRKYVPSTFEGHVTGEVAASYFALSECITKALRWNVMTPASDTG
eukprot:PhF_6_TR4333/c0_g1_i1/m.5838